MYSWERRDTTKWPAISKMWMRTRSTIEKWLSVRRFIFVRCVSVLCYRNERERDNLFFFPFLVGEREGLDLCTSKRKVKEFPLSRIKFNEQTNSQRPNLDEICSEERGKCSMKMKCFSIYLNENVRDVTWSISLIQSLIFHWSLNRQIDRIYCEVHPFNCNLEDIMYDIS